MNFVLYTSLSLPQTPENSFCFFFFFFFLLFRATPAACGGSQARG